MQKKTVDITEILSELKDKSQLIPGRDVKINFEPSGSRLVSANELIIDIFLNLIWNAIKHSDPKKPLVINLGIDEIMVSGKRYYKVAVEDNGPGIKDELKPKLFSRFSRGETKAKGSGLGLYLVKSLVEKFQGSVWVEDRVSGDHTMGARFVVMLPAIES